MIHNPAKREHAVLSVWVRRQEQTHSLYDRVEVRSMNPSIEQVNATVMRQTRASNQAPDPLLETKRHIDDLPRRGGLIPDPVLVSN